MKLLVILVGIALVGFSVYFSLSKLSRHNKRQKHQKADWKINGTTAAVVIALLLFVAFGMYKSATAPDTQCTTTHAIQSTPPASLTSAADYFMQGNYEYDRGSCKKAITDYTTSLQMNPYSPQTYNNRAYTYMRMQDYKDALPDLDKAIELNPYYIQALMNRGDIHNYYYAIDRKSAVVDYEKVISLGATHGTSVCGHLFLAKHNGWNIITFFDLPAELLSACD